MKKIMLMHTMIALYAVLNSPNASCQTSKAFAKTEIADIGRELDEMASINTVKGYEITIKAVREFIKKFGNIQNVTWHEDDGGFVAEFINDSVKTMVGYKDDDSWNYILKRYAEKRMSPDLRTLVKRTFWDYVIMEVTEITVTYAEDNTIYRVLIKNEDGLKILRIFNGDMEVTGHYTKP